MKTNAVPARPNKACRPRVRRSIASPVAPLVADGEDAPLEPLAVPLPLVPLGPLVLRTVVNADSADPVPETVVGIVAFPEPVALGIVAFRVPEPVAEVPLPASRYVGAGVAEDGSVSAPFPQAIPSVFSVASVDEPSVPAIVKRPVQVKLVGAAGVEN